jgi:hypothetical protein
MGFVWNDPAIHVAFEQKRLERGDALVEGNVKF